MIWRIAWRNLWRHKGRTWILVSVIAGTYAMALIGLSLGDDSHQRMLDEARRAAGGDVLVHGDGYWESRAADVVVADAPRVADRLSNLEGVAAVLPRVLVSGLLSTSSSSRGVFLQGVDPSAEITFRDLESDVIEGSFLGSGHDDPLVLGVELAEDLDAQLGDRIVLTASGPDGELARALFHLSGLLDSGAGIGNLVGFTTLDAAQRALAMDGAVTQIGLSLDVDEPVDDVAEAVRAALAGTDLEVLTWRQAVPEMVGFVELDDAFGYIYMAVIFVVVLFAITNTFLMAVMERVREFGLLSALGLRDGQVGRMLLAETVVLTALAMAIGLGLGFGAHLAVDHWGFSVASWGIEEIEISGIDMADMVIRSKITPHKWIAASVIVAFASVAAALYPAWRATQLAPSEAMRFYE